MVEHGKSLTPADRYNDAKRVATVDGAFSALCVGIGSGSGIWYLMKNSSSFRKFTNFQSRTALVIMPPLFAFALSSEMALTNFQRNLADETETQRVDSGDSDFTPMLINKTDDQLAEMYKEEVRKPFRIVKGDSLGMHHQFMK